MDPKASLLGAALGIALTGCFFEKEPEGAAAPEPKTASGMVLVHAKGRSFQQGSRGLWANPDEAPVLNSAFNYDYLVDTAEVTQG
jgi:hypothetical protein